MSYNSENEELFFSSVEDYHVLDAQTQKELVRKAQAGDNDSQDHLIMSNMRFIISFSKKYKNSSISLEEIISEATLGLMEAIQHFDVTKRVNFVSYATHWMRHYIEKLLHSSSAQVRLPMNKVRALNHIKKEKAHVMNSLELKEDKALAYVSENLNVDVGEITQLIASSQDTLSLNQEKGDETQISFLDSLPDSTAVSIEDEVEQAENLEILQKALHQIPPREADILSKRHGLGGSIPRSLHSISEEYGITKERVRQLEMKGIKRLRKIYSAMNFQYQTSQESIMAHIRAPANTPELVNAEVA